MSVHEKIRLARQAKGWTQEDIASKLDMSVNGYGDIERGDSDIKLSKLEKIAQLFEMSLSELINLNEKGVLNFACEQNKSNWHINACSPEQVQIKCELEKQQLLILEKDKIIAEKEKQIMLYQEMIEILKYQSNSTSLKNDLQNE